MDIHRLSDRMIFERLKELDGEERKIVRAFIEHLSVFEERGLAARTSFATTYRFCTEELRLSEGEAYRRMQVAGVSSRYPAILDLFERGALTLTAISVLAPHLNGENFERLTSAASGKSKREVEFLVAGSTPKHLPPDVVRALPAAAAMLAQPAPPVAARSFPAPAASKAVEVIAETHVRLHISASREVYSKLERARALLRHKFPSGEWADIIGEAVDALLDRRDLDRKEASAPEREVLPDRRRIPQFVKDVVWKRDSGRCSYEADGRRCGETCWLEYDHIEPFASGGKSDDPSNVRLLCRAHNQYLAKERFG